ncbi:MAG: hypothetical protein ACODAU_03485, partial [Myxococcota bacterium]
AGLRAVALDGRGAVRGPERSVAPDDVPPGAGADPAAQIVEVAAGAGGGRLGVAWVLRHGTGALQALAARADAAATTFGPPVDLGASEGGSASRRGRVAVAVSDAGDVDVLFRTTDGPCGDDVRGETCARFRHWQPGGERRGIPLVVPGVCSPPIAGSLFHGGRWYFGLCAAGEDGRPTTTLYGLQFEPEYAHAEPLLAGCRPQGVAPAPGGVLLAGRCDEGTRAVHVTEAGRQRAELGTVQRRAVCRGGHPVLVIEGEGGGAELPLSGALDGLSPWLPKGAAPAGARAAWTGEALLVAAPLGGEVAVRRFECDGERLIRTDVL